MYARAFILLSVLHFTDIEFEYQIGMDRKFLLILCAVLAVGAARSILPEDVEDLDELNKIEPRIYETKILEALNSLKDFLKNGKPEHGIPPLDPYYLSYKDFDFVIRDTALKGYLKKATFANFSGFEPVFVEFKLLPLRFKLEIFLSQFHADGMYEMLGNFFNEIPVNGTGKFTSETRNVTLKLQVRLTNSNSTLQIKDINFNFKVKSQKVNYTNELVDGKVRELDEKLALYILDQIQVKYIPPLMNTVKEILNHFLLGFNFAEIMKIILELLSRSNDI